jgi:FkbM family methyltransferase
MNRIRQFLKSAWFGQRLKTTYVFDFYLKLKEPRRLQDRSREADFYRRLLIGLRPGALIFDVGANVGSKTDVFLRLGARVVAVDPDETNQKIIRQRFLNYRLIPKPVTVIGKALSDKTSVETIWVDSPGSALNTLSKKWVNTLKGNKGRFAHTTDRLEFEGCRQVQTTTLEDLIATYGSPFFIKIDVEGYELKVLSGLRRPVPYVSFEVNLPEFRAEGIQCVELLSKLAQGHFNYAENSFDEWHLSDWKCGEDFVNLLRECSEPSVEVFWRSAEV